jgi:hypothetical protein
MIELSVSLASNGTAKLPGYEQLLRLGYTKNRGVYRLSVTASGEWEGLTIRAFWHVPGGKDPTSSLVADGYVDVPASVTAQPGNGCITFEGSDGTKTVTSADLLYRVAANSGTDDGTMPEPDSPAWQQLIDAVHTDAAAAEQAKTDAQTAASEAAISAGNADQSAQEAADNLQELKDGIANGDFKGDKGDTGERGPAGPQGETGPAGKDAPQIDDTAITATNPWSAKHIIDTLCPPLEETGNPVVCYPVADYPLGVTVSWEPVQEGSGDPSPDNIRPISGRDAVSVTRQENGQTITMTLPSTIYGGTVDAVTGEGQETWGTETITRVASIVELTSVLRCSATLLQTSVTAKAGSAISNWLREYVSYVIDKESFYTNQTQIYIKISKTRLLSFDVAGVDAYLSEHPLTVCYKLASPVPITATGAQPIPALSGINTVLTDADSATVTGRADPIKRITDLEDAVASMT